MLLMAFGRTASYNGLDLLVEYSYCLPLKNYPKSVPWVWIGFDQLGLAEVMAIPRSLKWVPGSALSFGFPKAKLANQKDTNPLVPLVFYQSGACFSFCRGAGGWPLKTESAKLMARSDAADRPQLQLHPGQPAAPFRLCAELCLLIFVSGYPSIWCKEEPKREVTSILGSPIFRPKWV